MDFLRDIITPRQSSGNLSSQDVGASSYSTSPEEVTFDGRLLLKTLLRMNRNAAVTILDVTVKRTT